MSMETNHHILLKKIAYNMWDVEKPHGRDLEFWYEAERFLDKWLLQKINYLIGRCNDNRKMLKWWPTHHNIWQGSFDVWHSEQDKIDSVELPIAIMQDGIDRGLIYKHEIGVNLKDKSYIWTLFLLTDLGKKSLIEQGEKLHEINFEFQRELKNIIAYKATDLNGIED